MLTRRQFVRSAALAAVTGPLIPSALRAQTADYPAGPIRTICMFPPGTGADVRVRFYANKLGALAGKPVIVENKPGAFGNIATEAVARARPDGYTIYITPGSSTHAAAPHIFKQLAFDPINDFEHITTLSTAAFLLCVAASSPFKTVPELTAHLKAQGDKASYGSIAIPGYVASEMYKAAFGLQTVEVKYKEPGGFNNDLLSGQLAFVHSDLGTIAANLRAGRVRALATTSDKRLAAVPDIPGAEEAGIPGMNLRIWWSVHVPAKTPKPICDKLEGWFNAIVADPETQAFNANTGADSLPGNSQMLKALLARETRTWGEYAKIAKIQME
jgi:tripartite-type tricarboxylate transporter receptor subunit TctC